jgi:hypothetical protein
VTKHGPRQPGQIQLASSGQIMLGKVSWALKYPYVDQQKASLISAAKNNCQAAVPTNCCSHVGAQTVTRRSQLSHCCSHVGAQTVAHTLLTTVTLLLTRRCAGEMPPGILQQAPKKGEGVPDGYCPMKSEA